MLLVVVIYCVLIFLCLLFGKRQTSNNDECMKFELL